MSLHDISHITNHYKMLSQHNQDTDFWDFEPSISSKFGGKKIYLKNPSWSLSHWNPGEGATRPHAAMVLQKTLAGI